ncbi:Resolvase, N-terminal domain protein [Candidatus Terasakiella magnetica]|uniref:Resolvase, N-terminal domain protein n=1 Tax=Candidatus Terasakiella magnetica TaxID=1867952 RepID=A0A1C3RFG8_9PROT|nr:Resolvase, N-terminal domain protein [Candidatus Terasakiella magnetica]
MKYGVDERDIYKEKESGVKRERPELNKVLELLREGDTLCVYRLDRLARSTRHMLEISELIDAKGANLISIHDHVDTKSIGGRCIFTIMSAIASMERELLISRTRHGQQVARDNGAIFGRPAKLTPDLVKHIQHAHKDPTVTVAATLKHLNISKSSYYNALKM